MRFWKQKSKDPNFNIVNLGRLINCPALNLVFEKVLLRFRTLNTIYLLNWFDLDKVAPGGMLGLFPPNDLLGDSKSVDIVNPCPNFFGDSRVL